MGMTTTILPPNSIDVYGYRVFLAGAIDMGAAENWQNHVIESLSDLPDLVLINPRRERFTPDTLDEQIDWELDALENANLILMWLPGTSLAPVSLFEAGLYWKAHNFIIGAGRDYYRRRNLEITGNRYEVPVHDDLQYL